MSPRSQGRGSRGPGPCAPAQGGPSSPCPLLSSPPNEGPTEGALLPRLEAPTVVRHVLLPGAPRLPGQGLRGQRCLLGDGHPGAGPPPTATPRARARARLWGWLRAERPHGNPGSMATWPQAGQGTGRGSGRGVCCADHPQWQVSPGVWGPGQGARGQPVPLRGAGVWVPAGWAHPQVPGHLLLTPRPGRESPAPASQGTRSGGVSWAAPTAGPAPVRAPPARTRHTVAAQLSAPHRSKLL